MINIINKIKLSAIHWGLKITCSLLSILFSFGINGQSLDLYGGINSIVFYDLGSNAPYNRSNYSFDPGFFLGVGIEDLEIENKPIRLTLSFEIYNGSASARSGGLGGGTSTTAKTTKTLMSLGISPEKYTIYKGLGFEPGFLFSLLIHETFSGSVTSSAGNIPTTINLNKDRDKFNSLLYFGIQTRFRYDFKFNQTSKITLFYSFYFGFLDEFKMFPKATKSMRHQIGLGYNL